MLFPMWASPRGTAEGALPLSFPEGLSARGLSEGKRLRNALGAAFCRCQNEADGRIFRCVRRDLVLAVPRRNARTQLGLDRNHEEFQPSSATSGRAPAVIPSRLSAELPVRFPPNVPVVYPEEFPVDFSVWFAVNFCCIRRQGLRWLQPYGMASSRE